MTRTLAPFARPLYLMAKPAGASCNLACQYCYYLEKARLYRHDAPAAGAPVMSDALLEKFVRDYIGSQTQPQVLFTWHGGEPLLRPLSFYRRAVALQRQYAGGRQIDNCIQTNGTLLTDEWCRFFKEQGWLVGLSVDGPQPLHDAYRRHASGRPTFDEVMRGIELLDRHGVEWNALATVNHLNAGHPHEFYVFFKQAGCRYIQFTPVVERLMPHADGRHLAAPCETPEAQLAPFSVRPGEWGDFLCTLFDEWVRSDVGEYFIQLFDATLANWAGVPPGVCTLAETCGHAAVMEWNGDVYACDHYVFPEYRLGNLLHDDLPAMLYSRRQLRFGRAKRDSLPTQCRRCQWLFACHGECPRNRFARTGTGEPGLNYLCEGYRRFFAHAAPYMDYMKREYLAGRPPAGIVEHLRRHPDAFC